MDVWRRKELHGTGHDRVRATRVETEDDYLETMKTRACWYLQGNYDSRESQVVQDFVHAQVGSVFL